MRYVIADRPISSTSETIADFIYRYESQQQFSGSPENIFCMDFVSTDFSIIYISLNTVEPISLGEFTYYSIPGLYTLLDNSSMGASGILATYAPPALNNQGRGIIAGIMDTGVDYTNLLFRNQDGTTGILSIWDQSLSEDKGLLPAGVPNRYNASGATYGAEYTREQTNEALEPDNSLTMVSSTDTNGHGIFLVGIAAGGVPSNQDFIGAALECELIIVKLKPVKQYLRDFYLVSNNANAYQENDVTMGIKYLRVEAYSRRKPLVALLGIGSNLGSHEGTPPLSVMIQDTSRNLGMVAVIAAGNKTGRGHHYMGSVPMGEEFIDVGIRVGNAESRRRFVVELWAAIADTYSAGFVSPSGESIDRVPVIGRNETSIGFLLEPTATMVNYQLIEAGTGKQLVFIRFEALTNGIWRICVYNTQYLTGQFNMWFPAHNLTSDETVFSTPSPYATITLPGDSISPITVDAYNHLNNSIYIHPGRGYTIGGVIRPDLMVPGVNVSGPSIGRRNQNSIPMTIRIGTSVAAAHVAGAVVNLLSWGIIEGHSMVTDEATIEAFLIRGAKRNPALPYSNRE